MNAFLETRSRSSRMPSPAREDSSSPDIFSDIEIDESAIKDEPVSADWSYQPRPNSPTECITMTKISQLAALSNSDLVFDHKNGCLPLTLASQSLLKMQKLAASAATTTPGFDTKSKTEYISTTNPATASSKHNGQVYGLPLTPPSCSSNEGDSEGSLIPEHLLSRTVSISGAPPPAVITPAVMCAVNVRRSASNGSSSSPLSASSTSSIIAAGAGTAGRLAFGGACVVTHQSIYTPFITSQPKISTGVLILTEEKNRTLQAKGYPLPQMLPLTEADEKSSKKMRRKINNRLSAQESRRRKKEYMDQLERRVEILVNENNEQRKRCEALEHTNANLLSQLHEFQAMLDKQNKKII